MNLNDFWRMLSLLSSRSYILDQGFGGNPKQKKNYNAKIFLCPKIEVSENKSFKVNILSFFSICL